MPRFHHVPVLRRGLHATQLAEIELQKTLFFVCPFLHFGFTVSGVPSVVAPYQINELNDNIDNIDIGSVTLSDIK